MCYEWLFAEVILYRTLVVGAGGYTTFSTFGYETVLLAREGSYALAAANVVGQVVLGLLAVWAGVWVARAVT